MSSKHPATDVPLHLDLGDVPGVTSPAPRVLSEPEEKRPALFEIGVVYSRGSSLYLAVSQRTLITLRDGEVQELRPTTRFEPARSVSVDELCRAWGISLMRLDALAAKYVTPAADGVKPRPRGSRRQSGIEELAGIVLRRVRVAG